MQTSLLDKLKLDADFYDRAKARVAQARQEQPIFVEKAKLLQCLTGGKFSSAPVKSVESTLISAWNSKIDPLYISDSNRGVIPVKTLGDIMDIRKNLAAFVETREEDLNEPARKIKQNLTLIRDRFAKSTATGLKGIFIGIHVNGFRHGEIQIHTERYWNAIKPLHAVYKDLVLLTAEHGATTTPPYIPGEAYQRRERLRAQRRSALAEIAHATGMHELLASNIGQIDCSWPKLPVNGPA